MNLEDRIAVIERRIGELQQQMEELVAVHIDMASLMLSYETRQRTVDERLDIIGRTVSTHASRLNRLEQDE